MSTLTDRYLLAVTLRLPERRRAEVASGLRARIDHLVRGRPDLDPAGAERMALLELGDPAALAAAYGGGADQLIGPEVFPLWRRVMVILLVVVPGVAAVVTALAALLSANSGGAAEAIATALANAVWAAIHVAFWVTLGFAVVERTPEGRARVGRSSGRVAWTPEQLPEPRQIAVGQSVAGVVAWAVLATIVAVTPNPGIVLDGAQLRLFTDAALAGRWVLVALFAAFVGMEATKLVVGQWTLVLASVNAMLQTAFSAILAWAILAGGVISDAIAAAAPGVVPQAWRVLLVLIAVVIAAWDAVRGFVLASRVRRAG